MRHRGGGEGGRARAAAVRAPVGVEPVAVERGAVRTAAEERQRRRGRLPAPDRVGRR